MADKKHSNLISDLLLNYGTVLKFCYITLVAGFVLLPMIVAILGGFKTLGDLRSNPFGLPETWDFEVFADLFSSETLWLQLWNSFKIAMLTVFFTLLLGSMAAFVFAQIRFFGDKFLYGYLLAGMMFPSAAAILPLFIKVRDLGLVDSHIGLIMVQVAFGLGFSVLLLKTFFEQLPKELFEAAHLEGCGYARFYWSFTLPLSLPILATVGTFTLVGSWNSYLLPLVLINDESLYPWPLGIMVYQGEFGIEWNRILAFVTITMIPAIAFFLAAQKYIVAGLTGGAVKG